MWATCRQNCWPGTEEEVLSAEREGVQEGFTEEVVWLSSEGWSGFPEVEVKGPV